MLPLLVSALLAAQSAGAATEEQRLFDKSAAICTALVLNPQGYSEEQLEQLEAQIAARERYSKDVFGTHGIRFSRNGFATLSFSYSQGSCTVGVSREVLATPDVQGLVDKAAKALNLTFERPKPGVWRSPRLSVSYSPPSASDIDQIANVTFERPK